MKHRILNYLCSDHIIVQTKNISDTHNHRVIFLLLLLAIAFFITALTLLLYYWDLLVGIYQTVFLLFGFLPSVVAFFVVLYLWMKQTREDAIRRLIQEEERNKPNAST